MADETDDWQDVEQPQVEEPDAGSVTDDWQDVESPEQPAPVQASGEDEWTDVPAGASGAGDTPAADKYSPLGSAAVGAATGVVPVGGAAAAAGAVGLATSGALTPIGGALAGLGTFALLNYLGENAQDKLLSIMGLDKTVKAAMTDNPTSFEVGHMAPGFALGSPVGTLAQRGIGAAVGGAGAGIMDATQGKFDPKNIAIGAGAGFAMPGLNKAGSKVIEGGASALERLGGNLYRGAGGRYRGGNTNPDLKEVPAEDPQGGEQAPQEDEITVSNDVEQTAPGVAMENGPVQPVVGAGNPEGAPMAAREAARPNDAIRNYQKDQPQNQPGTTESKVIDTEPMKSDIKAALAGDEPESVGSPGGENSVEAQAPHPADGADVPPEQGAVPTTLTPEQEQANLAAQQAQHKQASALPASVDPLEASQMQRHAAAGIKDRVAAQQKGEAFEGLDHAVPSPKLVPEQAPEALTPAERKSLAEDRAILAKAGWDRALAALDRVSPREQLEAVRQGANTIRQETATQGGAKPSEGEARRPTGELRKEPRKKVGETGVLAASKGDAARKSAAINTVKGIYDEFGPTSEKGKAINPLDPAAVKDTRAYTKQVWEAAVKANGGRDPLVRSPDQYVPIQKGDHTDAYQWLKAVKASAKGQNHKNFMTLHTTEGMGKMDEQTGRVEGDIAHRPQINEAGAEAETSADAGRETSRTPIEDWADPEHMESKVYGDQQAKLRDWINNLDDVDYTLVKNSHPDLEQNVRTTQDPQELHQNLMDDLTEAQKRRPKGEITSEVDLPTKKVDLPNLPSREEPINTVRTVPKGSDEFKRLAAMYETAGKGPVKSKAQQLDDLKAKEATFKEADASTAKLEAERAPFDYREAVKGDWGSYADKLKRFAGDESGAGKIPAWAKALFSPSNPAAPNAKPAIDDYVKSIGGDFKRHIGREKNILMSVNGPLGAAPDLDNARWSRIGRAVQNRATNALPADLKKVYDDHVAPLRDRSQALAEDIHQFIKDNKLHVEFVDPTVKGPAKDFMPRRKIGEQVYDKDDVEKFDALSGRSLSIYSPSMIEREWMGLHNPTTNDRLTVQRTTDPDGSTKMTVWRNGKPQVLKNFPASLKGDVGDKINLTMKGKKQDWLFDHASTDEIKAATGGKVAFHENPMMAFSHQITELGRVLNNMKLLKSLTEDPRWEEHTTLSVNEARAKGYDLNPVDLEALGRRNGKQVYMPANLRWALNSYVKQGFGGTSLDPARRLTANVFKTFFALTPIVHPLNELDLAVVSRGSMWVTPEGTRSLIRNMPRAIKSVNEQDYIQQAINSFGGNPMLASVKVRRMFPDAARRMGMDVTNNAPKWDPIAKIWGVSTGDLARNFYDTSSDVTWRLSDYLLTLRVLENMDQGHSIESAVQDAHRFVSDYHVPPTILGKGKVGQFMSAAITEPFLVAFGRYKYGWLKAYANMTKDLVKGTPAQRNKAIGQLGVAMALAWMVYPAIDKGLQAVSGNKDAEIGRRGFSTLPHAISKSAQTHNATPAISALVTPAPAVSMGMEAARNQDWNGKPILPEGVEPFTSPVRSAGYAAEWAAKNLVPPYNSISQGMSKQGGGVLPTAGRFLGEQVGAKFPTDRAVRFEQQGPRRVNQQERQRLRHGEPGIIPDLYDRVTGRK